MVSRAITKMSVSFTKAVNKRYSRVGQLFQGVFQAKQIGQNASFWRITDYIHKNQAATGLVQHPKDWKQSRCRVYISLKEAGYLDRIW